MAVVKPPPPREGISLYRPADNDAWYVGSSHIIEWVSADDLKDENVQITITAENDSIDIMDFATENTGFYKINSFLRPS